MPHDQEGQEVQQEIIDTQDALAKVHIAEPSRGVVTNGTTSPNPWEEAAQAKELPLSPTAAQLNALDFAALDAVTARGLAASHDGEDERDKADEEKKEEILHEFDPLESHEEEAARAAWAASEAHPPPAAPPQPVETATAAAARIAKQEHVLASSQPATPARAPSPLPSFPSLAALARTFALPLTSGSSRSKPRPLSMDSAAPVPSPATISSFAAQQSAPPLSTASSSSADAIGSGRNTPTGVKGKNGAEQFDFQRFLDQMKLKGAEPVAKYLRSYVGCELSGRCAC